MDGQIGTAGEARLAALLEPGVKALGFELLLVEFVGRGHASVLRVYIDGPNGVTVDDCAQVSEQLSGILDVEDPIPGRYTLEVSSPGLDRPLAKPEHFQKVVGRRIRLQLASGAKRRLAGRLIEMRGDVLLMEIGAEVRQVPLGEVRRARLVPEV